MCCGRHTQSGYPVGRYLDRRGRAWCSARADRPDWAAESYGSYLRRRDQETPRRCAYLSSLSPGAGRRAGEDGRRPGGVCGGRNAGAGTRCGRDDPRQIRTAPAVAHLEKAARTRRQCGRIVPTIFHSWRKRAMPPSPGVRHSRSCRFTKANKQPRNGSGEEPVAAWGLDPRRDRYTRHRPQIRTRCATRSRARCSISLKRRCE